jgi:hypothetical protein
MAAGILSLSVKEASAEQPRRIAVAGELGYAFPAGSVERGADLSDSTSGLVELGLDGAYRLHRSLSAGIGLHYGLSIPNLCATSSDCLSSLGRDFRVGALARWHLGKWRSFEPDMDLELGYEWLRTQLADMGVTSKRANRGFEASVRAHGQFALWRRVSIGPTLALTFGTFSHASLEAPGLSAERETDGSRVHLWTCVGFRTSTTW